MRCNNCGNEVSSGNFTITRGFVCYSCSAGLGVGLCPDCGNKYPRSDLVEFKGRLYCTGDYGRRFRTAEKEAELAKTAMAKSKNVMKSKMGVGKRLSVPKMKAKDLGLLGKYDAFKQKYGPKPRPKQDKPGSIDQVKQEIREILRQELDRSFSLGNKDKRKIFTDILSQLRDKTRGKPSK